MSLETELKKIAVNLQQLTDATVTLTATLEKHAPPIVEHIDVPANIAGAQVQMGAGASGSSADTVIPDEVDTTIVDINKNQDVDGAAELVTTGMSMQDANMALQEVVQKLADGGVAVRDLLKKHKAITLAQIAPENYESFVNEARALIPANQA